MSKREVISCLSLACVTLISSRSPERASLGGFPAGKREILSLHGNRSVERLEEQLLLYLEYHPQVAWYGRGDISSTFASTYKIATPLPTPYTIDYLFEGKAHVYLPDAIGQLLDGRFLIAEAGLEQDKRRERNRAKAEAARKVAEQQAGVYWIGTEATLSRTRHANLVFLHARRQAFPAWSQLEEALQVVWPWGEAACVQELVERLGERWPQAEREAAVWKHCAESAATPVTCWWTSLRSHSPGSRL